MSLVSLSIEAGSIDRLVLELDATEKDATRALRSTVSKMTSWLRTRAARSLSGELKLKNAGVRKRLKSLKFKKSADGGVGGLWIGTNPIDLKYIGDAMQDSSGVSSRGQRFKGAFMGTRPGVQSIKLQGNAFVRKRRTRLPIEKVGLDVKAQMERALESDVMEFARFEAQFMKTFEHELRWRTQTQK